MQIIFGLVLEASCSGLRVCICCWLRLKLGLETREWKFMMILKLPSIIHTLSCHLAHAYMYVHMYVLCTTADSVLCNAVKAILCTKSMFKTQQMDLFVALVF